MASALFTCENYRTIKNPRLICSAYGCSNNRSRRQDLSFFRFPKEKDRSEQWVINCRREDLLERDVNFLCRNCKLCAEHFSADQFVNVRKKNALVWNAVPTIFPLPKRCTTRDPKEEVLAPPNEHDGDLMKIVDLQQKLVLHTSETAVTKSIRGRLRNPSRKKQEMLTTYKKKRVPPQTHSPATVLEAVKAVEVGNKSICHVSENMKIPYQTLSRYCGKVHSQQCTGNLKASKYVFQKGGRAAKSVFSSIEERELKAIIKEAMGTYYGMTAKQVRHLAYDVALAFRCDFPASWMKTQQAGYDWFLDFIQRHSELADNSEDAVLLPISTPSCSKTIDHYSKHFKLLRDQLHLEAEDIWCMGEIAISTLPRPHRVFGRSGTRPESQMTLCSGREGAVTMALCISASGASIPPFLVVPSVPENNRSKSTSEWLGKSLFLDMLKHFVQHASSCPGKQRLLLIDGHLSYFSMKAIKFCKLNDITLLAFPHHYCNTLNPLHRTLLYSVKSHINTSWDSWIARNPDTKISVNHIPEIIPSVLTNITSSSIKEAFNEAGIYPLSNSLLLLIKFRKRVSAYYSGTENKSTAAPRILPKMEHREATEETVFIYYEANEEEIDFDPLAGQEDPLGDIPTLGSIRTHESSGNSPERCHEDSQAEVQEVKYNPYMVTLPQDQSSGSFSCTKNDLYINNVGRDFIETEKVQVEDPFEDVEVKIENDFMEDVEVKVENYFFKTHQMNVEKDFYESDQVNNDREFIKTEEVKVEVKDEDIWMMHDLSINTVAY